MELINLIIEFNEYLEQSVLFRGVRFVVGVVVVVLALDILVLLYMLLVKDKYYRAFSLGHGIPNIMNTMERRWKRVVRMVKSEDVRQQKEAIVESGNMVYEVLKSIGYEGDTLDKMLNGIVEQQFANIDDLKKASGIKNLIVNDKQYNLSREVAMETVRTFGEVLAEHQTIKAIDV